MSSIPRTIWRSVLLLVALVLPVLLTVQIVRAVSVPANALDGLRLQSVPLSETRPADALPAPMAGAGPAVAPPASAISGVLYTRGRARVDWNGVSIPVQDGSYAYEGGETIVVEPGAMGLLRLSDGSSVFICPGATARVAMAEDGRMELSLEQGTSRFAFRRAQPFVVHAGNTRLSPSRAREGSQTDEFFVGEAKAYEEGGCLLCTLKNDLALAGAQALGEPEQVPVGTIAEARPHPSGKAGLSVGMTPIPDRAMSLIRAAAAGDGAGARYLCRCDELHEYARDRGAGVADSDGQNQLPDTDPNAPDALPEILPPDAPPLALAEPGPPDPFDPNVLPPPAAGEPTDPVVTVAPPAVPGGGSGGGGIASPS